MGGLIIVDSREKPKAIGKILDYFEKHDRKYMVSKMLFGDYMLYSRPGLVIDRKQNIAELAKNCTAEHQRFRRELERVQAAEAKLIVLVEQNRYKDRGKWVDVKEIRDLMMWSSPHTVVTGEKVFRVLASWTAKYPLEVRFCDKRSTGRMICEILEGGSDGR